MANPVVGIIMGSRSDWGVMENRRFPFSDEIRGAK